jgi:hypothetical protein
MDTRIPFVIFTVLGAINSTAGGIGAIVKTIAWLGMVALLAADTRYRQRRAGWHRRSS